MNHDTLELQRVAQACAPRIDLYAGIHKALRAQMTDTLGALGRMDADDADDVGETLGRVRHLLDVCRDHLRHENAFVHAAIERRAPGASDAIAHEHDDHLRDIARLGDACGRLADGIEPDRAAAALALYRDVALFVAHNFEHMHVEETAHNAVLWAHYTDAELIEIHNALVASIPPAEMMDTARWMVPSMTPAERAAMLGDMQAHAPAPAFEAVLAVARPHLSGREWGKLSASLGLAA